MLLARAFLDDGRLDPRPLLVDASAKPSHRAAFVNSLLLGDPGGHGRHGAGLPVRLHGRARELGARDGYACIDAATLLPLISPPFTTSISFIFSFGPRGLITYDLLGLKGVNVYGLYEHALRPRC